MEPIYSGTPRFNWGMEGALSSQWNAVSYVQSKVYSSRACRISRETLEATKDMAYVLTNVEFSQGIPVLTEEDGHYLTLAGMVTGGVMCRVMYSQRAGEHHQRFVVMFSRKGERPQETIHKTIEAAMTDFCKELMLVNPYDHILETIGARGVNHNLYQSNEEFGSWA